MTPLEDLSHLPVFEQVRGSMNIPAAPAIAEIAEVVISPGIGREGARVELVYVGGVITDWHTLPAFLVYSKGRNPYDNTLEHPMVSKILDVNVYEPQKILRGK